MRNRLVVGAWSTRTKIFNPNTEKRNPTTENQKKEKKRKQDFKAPKTLPIHTVVDAYSSE